MSNATADRAQSYLDRFDELEIAMDLITGGNKNAAVATFRKFASLVNEMADWFETLSEDEVKDLEKMRI